MKKRQPVAKLNISIPAELHKWIFKKKQELDRKNYPSTTSTSAIIAAAIREMQDRERQQRDTQEDGDGAAELDGR